MFSSPCEQGGAPARRTRRPGTTSACPPCPHLCASAPSRNRPPARPLLCPRLPRPQALHLRTTQAPSPASVPPPGETGVRGFTCFQGFAVKGACRHRRVCAKRKNAGARGESARAHRGWALPRATRPRQEGATPRAQGLNLFRPVQEARKRRVLLHAGVTQPVGVERISPRFGGALRRPGAAAAERGTASRDRAGPFRARWPVADPRRC